ncbi:hypothetical protein BJV77DRAFT_945507 [Russula vinacea]|nr:hypothetical protein BJV77DRAFT_945507 [Russula vinacea]
MGSATSNISPERDLLDLRGRVAIVTGAKCLGYGLYIALHLVRRGAKVYLAARSEEKAEHAIGRMEQEGMGERKGKLVWLPIDLTDPHKAKAAAEWFVKRESRLDILGTHISPFLFTKTLLPVMKKTALEPGSDVRIVNVRAVHMSSGVPDSRKTGVFDAHRWVPNPRKSLKKKWVWEAYTKLANLLWTAELQRRFDAEKTPITAMAVHPGNVMSGGLSFHIGEVRAVINWGFSLFFISPHDGGYTPAWAAASRQVFEERDKYKGKYLVPFGVLEEASEDARREDLAKELWDTTEGILKIQLAVKRVSVSVYLMTWHSSPRNFRLRDICTAPSYMRGKKAGSLFVHVIASLAAPRTGLTYEPSPHLDYAPRIPTMSPEPRNLYNAYKSSLASLREKPPLSRPWPPRGQR